MESHTRLHFLYIKGSTLFRSRVLYSHMTLGEQQLQSAQWLLGFDFDGTLADVHNNHQVHHDFFEALNICRSHVSLAWGICTGRSLEFLLEGLAKANVPEYPDYIVTQERDLFYHQGNALYLPDAPRNQQALDDLNHLMHRNAATINKVKNYVTKSTQGEWVSIPGDPAGIIATCEDEISHAVSIIEECSLRSEDLDYQRNTIYLRLSHKAYCKGTAIQYLQQRFQIRHEHSLVMGDNYNDLTMLNKEVAQHYAAPSNAIPSLVSSLQESGGLVASAPHSHGVAEIMLHLIKPPTTKAF